MCLSFDTSPAFLYLLIIFLFSPHNNKQKTFNLQCKLTLRVV